MKKLCKQITFVMLFISLCLSALPVSVLAEGTEDTALILQGQEAEVLIPDVEEWPIPAEISAQTGVVMELTTAIVQYNKGRDEKRYIGELAKYMVLLLAAENCDLEEEIVFTETALSKVTEEQASIQAQVGEIMTVKDCLYAISLASANDATLQLAEYVGGTDEDFLNMMNKRAKQLGCKNTWFTSITGVNDEESYSTAYDMALIIRAGIKNESFRKVVSKTSYSIPKTNMSKKRKLSSEIAIIDKESEAYYDRCRIANTTYSEKNGYHMVLAAKKEDVTFIVVTLGNPTEEISYGDGRVLLDYAHDNFIKLEYKLGTLVWPKSASTDPIEVTGTIEDDMLIHRYYVGSWLVGKGSQAIYPESVEETEEDLAVEEDSDEYQEENEIWVDVDEEDTASVSTEYDENGLDLVVTEKTEYFTIYGRTLTEWEYIGALMIIVSAILIFLGTLIKMRWKAGRRKKQRARQRRLEQYEEQQKETLDE